MRTLWVAVKALVLMTGFLSLWGWASYTVRAFDRHFGVQLPAWTASVGMPVLLVGGILGLSCVGMFIFKGRGTPAPFDAPKIFVAAGPYRHVRNPMYVGGTGMLVGFGMIERSPSMLLFAAGFVLLAHLFVLRMEEPSLRRKFGAAYEEYCRSVPRWFPRL